MRPREDDLWPAAGHLDAQNQRADAVSLAVALTGNLLFLQENRVGLAQVDDDIFLLEALDDAVEQLPLAALEFVVDDFSFGVADSLNDILFCGLRRDAAEG